MENSVRWENCDSSTWWLLTLNIPFFWILNFLFQKSLVFKSRFSNISSWAFTAKFLHNKCHQFLQYFILHQLWIVDLKYVQNDSIQSRFKISMFATLPQNYFPLLNWNYFLSFQTTILVKLLRRNVYFSLRPYKVTLFHSTLANPLLHWQSCSVQYQQIEQFWVSSIQIVMSRDLADHLISRYFWPYTSFFSPVSRPFSGF